jgi:hypothetical protein
VDHHVAQRLLAAVVHVGRRHGDVAQRRGLEGSEPLEVAGDREAPELGGALVAQHLDVHLGQRRLRLEERPGERGHVVLDVVDADADVVEAVVGEERRGLLDHVAGHAATLVDEEVEPALLLLGERLVVTPEVEAVEGRVSGHLGALEGRDRLRHLLHRHLGALLAEHLLERLHVLGVRADDLQDRLVVLEPHLHRVDEGVQRLVFEARRAAVPELAREVGRVHHGGRVARPGERLAALLDALRGAERCVGEGLLGVVAGGAGYLAGRAEAFVLEQLVAELDLLERLRVVRRDRDGRQPQRRLGRGGVCRQRGRRCEGRGDE